jgi:hypothetical protein
MLDLGLASIRDDFDHAKGCLDINEMKSSNKSYQLPGLSLILRLMADCRDLCYSDCWRGRHPLGSLIPGIGAGRNRKKA